jgi:small GTP-binding protein
MEAKLVVMGNTGVGKTSLVTRYTEDRFSARTTATTGALFVSHKTDFSGFQVKLQIWDTAGWCFFIHSLLISLFRRCHGLRRCDFGRWVFSSLVGYRK